jgi:hypothetical protein
VCGRCTGFYLAAAAGVLLALAGASAARRGGRHRAWLLLAAAPSLAAVVLEWFGPWAVSNAWRAVAAAPVGLVVGALLVEAAGFRGRL